MFKDRKVLVAGGSGFLGGACVKRLLSEGVHVRATWRTKAPAWQHPRLEWRQADLEDAQDCRAVAQGMDFVFMCAANTSGAAQIVCRPLIHVTPNVVMNARMLEAAYEAGVRKYLFLSSAAAYPPFDRPLAEDDMFSADPADVYYPVGWMKRYAEILCRTYAKRLARPMATVVVRPSNVYGPGDKFDWEHSHVTAALIRRVVERHDPMEIWGNGEDERDLIYVDDFITGVLQAFAVAEDHLTINIGSGRMYSVKEVLFKAMEVDHHAGAEVRFDPSRPRTIGRLELDIGLARRLFDFRAETELAEGLRRTIDWYRGEFPAEGSGT